MFQPSFSIIIPTYNCALHLEECIQSIINSGLEDDEIILVDDGSEDLTDALCERLALNHSCIRVFQTDHQGVAHARNVGIENATRDLLLFVDGDDLWSSSFCLNQLRAFLAEQDCDLWAFGYRIRHIVENVSDPDKSVVCPPFCFQNWRNDLDLFLLYFPDGMMFPCWNKVFKKDIVLKFNIRFQQQQMEDFLFVLDYLDHVSSVTYLSIEPYVYCKRKDSHSLTGRVRFDMLEGYYHCHQRLLSLVGPTKADVVHQIMAPQYIGTINRCLTLEDGVLSRSILNRIEHSELAKQSLKKYHPVSPSDRFSNLLMRHRCWRGLFCFRKCADGLKGLFGLFK